MKKIILMLLLLALAGGIHAQVQNIKYESITVKQLPSKRNAIGIFTTLYIPTGIEYQHSFSNHGRLSFDFNLMGFPDPLDGPIFVKTMYQFTTSLEKHFRAYAGLGVAAGQGWGYRSFDVGTIAQVGIEYRFNAPWIVSLDGGTGMQIDCGCPDYHRFGLGVKYAF